MKSTIFADFEICISVPLMHFQFTSCVVGLNNLGLSLLGHSLKKHFTVVLFVHFSQLIETIFSSKLKYYCARKPNLCAEVSSAIIAQLMSKCL